MCEQSIYKLSHLKKKSVMNGDETAQNYIGVTSQQPAERQWPL